MRAEQELRANEGRTWFVTLTLSPESHYRCLIQAKHRLGARGEDFDRLSDERQFKERVHEAGREITLWLKRLRKNSGAPLRYLLVAERHKSGLPHFHALLHEVDERQPLRAATLKSAWRLGFSQCKLVALQTDPRCAAYVAKYLSKDAAARVRASKGYGQAAPLTSSDIEHLVHEMFVQAPSLTHRPGDRKGLLPGYDCSTAIPGLSRITPHRDGDGPRLSGWPSPDCVTRERPELFSAGSDAQRDVPSSATASEGIWAEAATGAGP